MKELVLLNELWYASDESLSRDTKKKNIHRHNAIKQTALKQRQSSIPVKQCAQRLNVVSLNYFFIELNQTEFFPPK